MTNSRISQWKNNIHNFKHFIWYETEECFHSKAYFLLGVVFGLNDTSVCVCFFKWKYQQFLRKMSRISFIIIYDKKVSLDCSSKKRRFSSFWITCTGHWQPFQVGNINTFLNNEIVFVIKADVKNLKMCFSSFPCGFDNDGNDRISKGKQNVFAFLL